MNRTLKFPGVDKKRPAVFGRYDVLFSVTHQTTLIRHSLVIKNPSGLVGLMAVGANGNNLRALFPKLSFDDFTVDIFDLGMAL